MATVPVTPEFYEAPPFVVLEYRRRRPFLDGSHPSSARPYQNLLSKRPGIIPIAHLNPSTKRLTTPETLAFGASSSQRLSDEAVRQFSIGAYIANLQNSFFRTVNR